MLLTGQVKTLQENKNLLAESAASVAAGRGSRKTKLPMDRPATYTVLIELRDGENQRPTVRLSSCDSDDTSG